MADERSEEFRKFILENREIIESILNDAKNEAKRASDEIIGDRVDQAKDKTREFSDAVFRIVSDDDVQRHFIGGCLEFLHFFEAVLTAAPLPPEAREVADRFEETKEKAIANVVATGVKDKMGGSQTKKSKKKDFESIEIKDLSKKS